MTKKPVDSPFPRKMRDNVEAAAMAILMAVGLKYFLVEAFEIPTPSMQPALMGSKDTGIHDRILVNKAAYLLRQPPRRWDIAVFRYPHNQSQDYVKRIVGLPGERLRLVHGDVYRVTTRGNAPRTYSIVRKPPGLQPHLWKSMYAQEDDDSLEETFHFRSAKGIWHVADTELTADGTAVGGARTVFMPRDEPRDHYWHGYPAFLRDRLSRIGGQNVVGDLRWTLVVVPGPDTEKVLLWHREKPVQGPERAACLRLERTGPEHAAATIEFYPDARILDAGNGSAAPQRRERVGDVAFAAGSAIEVAFANYDDRLEASVGGRRLPAVEYRARPEKLQYVELALECHGKARFRDATLARDLFYEPTREEPEKIYEVPADHYWMLGDNQKKSDDGRSWRALHIWVDARGRFAPRGRGRMIAGNARYFYNPAVPGLDPDENPVYVPSRGKFVFTDLYGEEHVLTGTHEEFIRHVADYRVTGGAVRFVPRRFVVGRAFATFWPANPFGWFRVGWIR